jgi:hypothetical protein
VAPLAATAAIARKERGEGVGGVMLSSMTLTRHERALFIAGLAIELGVRETAAERADVAGVRQAERGRDFRSAFTRSRSFCAPRTSSAFSRRRARPSSLSSAAAREALIRW